MRLIGNLDSQKQAFVFYSFLLSEGIHSTYEQVYDPEEKRDVVAIWIYEEDEIQRALALLAEYKQNPEDPKFSKIEFPEAPPQPPDLIAQSKEKESPKTKLSEIKIPPRQKRKKIYPFTYAVIFICVFLFFITIGERVEMIQEDGAIVRQLGWTPVQQVLMFDYPKSNQEIDAIIEKYNLKDYKKLENIPSEELAQINAAQKIPTWRGFLPKVLRYFGKFPKDEPIDGPMFVKIRAGEVYRLFTPCLLHGGFLHILFNMAWAWILLRQVEDRLSLFKLLLLVVITGVVANIAQYLVSGPYFLGFSGVVVGLVGFIWARQKVAPWEGYPLNKTTFIFILVFVLAMFVLELFSLMTAIIAAKEISANIANTAHIIGGITGYLLGRIPFFSRGFK